MIISRTFEFDSLLSGWWLPLKQNFIAWRAIAYQEPLSKYRFSAGLVSLNVEGGNLNVAFDGRQLYRVDQKGLEWKNMRVDIASPNDIPDARPFRPNSPHPFYVNYFKKVLEALPSDYCLPWADMERLCPKGEFESRSGH